MDRTGLAKSYLDRLGLDAEPPTAAALTRLHRAHVERVPWETLWIHCGETWGTDPIVSARRIADTGRGGYCYHLNGAFAWLLDTLGYDVRHHVGGVHGPEGPTRADLTNHLVLTVHGLESETAPSGDWYVDVGLGDALHEPLPLAEGSYPTGPFELRLGPAEAAVGDWHLEHHAGGSFSGMAWSAASAEMSEFAERHRYLSGDASSRFVRFLVLSRRDADGADLLRGLGFSRVGANSETLTVSSERQLFDLIGDRFGADVGTISPAVRREVWERADVAHRAFLEAHHRPSD